jgi:uncharacterized coiled-coil protein SlyX
MQAVEKGILQKDTLVEGHFDNGDVARTQARAFGELGQLFTITGRAVRGQSTLPLPPPGGADPVGEALPIFHPPHPDNRRDGDASRSAPEAAVAGHTEGWRGELAARDARIERLELTVKFLEQRIDELKRVIETVETSHHQLTGWLGKFDAFRRPPESENKRHPEAAAIATAPTAVSASPAQLVPAPAEKEDSQPETPLAKREEPGLSLATQLAAAPAMPATAGVPLSLSGYADLLSGGKPRQFASFFAEFDHVRSIRMAGGEVIAAPFSGNDADELLVALGDGSRHWVVPTYDYVSVFPTAFSAAIKNPPLVSHFFELTADGSGRLALSAPAAVRLEGPCSLKLVSRGSLSGYVS